MKKSVGSRFMVEQINEQVLWACNICATEGSMRVNNWNSPRARTCCGGSFYKGRDRLQIVWTDMHSRTSDPKHPAYSRYCAFSVEGWNDLKTFKVWALLNGYKYGLDLDRIDNRLGYSPENCRFVTRKENSRNRSNNMIISAFGETKTLAEWAEDSRCSVQAQTISARINRYKWDDIEKSISAPSQNKK